MSKIFVVEDEKTIREELSIFLSRYGYEVEAPEDFENIIENIKGSNCDLSYEAPDCAGDIPP